MISILDVSSIIYGGHYGTVANGRASMVNGFPVGGLWKLFGIIASNMSTSDFALAFDGDKILKKELLPEYKANRVPNYSIYAEIEMAKELCSLCNIPIIFDSQYEADDSIYSLCYYISLLSQEAERMTIYSDDRDLACCVTKAISVHNVTTQGRHIDFSNFKERAVNGFNLPYNMILPYKLFTGDASDNYRGSTFTGITMDMMFSEIDNKVQSFIADGWFMDINYSDYDIFANIVKEISYLSTDTVEDILTKARIVYPYIREVGNIPFETIFEDVYSGKSKLYQGYRNLNVFDSGNIDLHKFVSICKTLGVPCHGSNKVSKDKEIADLLYLRGKELSSGDFMVSKAISRKKDEPAKNQLLTMEIPNELF